MKYEILGNLSVLEIKFCFALTTVYIFAFALVWYYIVAQDIDYGFLLGGETAWPPISQFPGLGTGHFTMKMFSFHTR